MLVVGGRAVVGSGSVVGGGVMVVGSGSVVGGGVMVGGGVVVGGRLRWPVDATLEVYPLGMAVVQPMVAQSGGVD